MSKGYDLKKIISNWEREGTLEQKIEALEKIPENVFIVIMELSGTGMKPTRR